MLSSGSRKVAFQAINLIDCQGFISYSIMNFRTANGTTNLGDHSKDDMCAKKKEESGNRGVREKEKARRGNDTDRRT